MGGSEIPTIVFTPLRAYHPAVVARISSHSGHTPRVLFCCCREPESSRDEAVRDAWLSVVTVADDNDQSIQQARLARALGNPFGVCRILEWQPINMIFQ